MGAEDRKEETRTLVISDFRNLGVSALRRSKDEVTELKINRGLKKDEIGGLVIILGGNNCGKTNVLDAVAKCPRGEFDEATDYTDFVVAPKIPRLRMSVADGKYGEILPPKIAVGTAKCKIFGPVQDVILYILAQRESYELYEEWIREGDKLDIEAYMNRKEEQIRCYFSSMDRSDGEAYAYIIRHREGLSGTGLDEIANALENGDISEFVGTSLEVFVKGTPIDDVELVDFEKRRTNGGTCTVPVYVLKERAKEYRQAQGGGIKGIAKRATSLLIRNKPPFDPLGELVITDLSGGVKDTEVVPDEFSKVYGYNLSNRVFKYKPRKISNSDLTTDVVDTNAFITQIFSLLGYDNKSIINKYYEIPSNRDKLEDQLNEELKVISNELNRLLNTGEREYGLHIRLDKSEIRLSISCGPNKSLNLDHQSEGFRWIFGFFINFLMSKKFVAGDIVIVDEFGGLLNFGTVAELTEILREFSRKHGITFVMATQNPMAIDIDHLDEVRMVVPRDDGGSEILNDFTEFGRGECTDVLRPIVASMTVGRNFLRSENRSTVFVENYRDYFYLSSFNDILGYDIDFIPVNGITEYTSEERFAKALRSIERSPVLLADTEIHDEASIEELRRNKVNVFTVSEIFDSKGSVSELFSAEDNERLLPADASFDRAANLSYSLPLDDMVTDETKENFRKVIDFISME